MILWIDRVLQKCIREYRKAVFRKKYIVRTNSSLWCGM